MKPITTNLSTLQSQNQNRSRIVKNNKSRGNSSEPKGSHLKPISKRNSSNNTIIASSK